MIKLKNYLVKRVLDNPFGTTLLEFGHKTVQGEACSPDDVARDFKESAACHAEAVTPIGGHWLRHHVLKAESAPAEIAL